MCTAPAVSKLDGDFGTGNYQVVPIDSNGTYLYNQVWQRFLKRAIDIVISVLAILVLWPFSVLIAIAIKLTSVGPVFFCQERVGYEGQLFSLLKFRTMKANCDK